MSYEEFFSRSTGQSAPTTTIATEAAGSNQMQEEPSREVNTNIARIKDLDAIVEQFRNKKLTYTRAIAHITSRLSFDLTKDEPEKDAALDQFITTLNAIERLTIESSNRGSHAAR